MWRRHNAMWGLNWVVLWTGDLFSSRALIWQSANTIATVLKDRNPYPLVYFKLLWNAHAYWLFMSFDVTIRNNDDFTLNCHPTVPVGYGEQVPNVKCSRPSVPCEAQTNIINMWSLNGTRACFVLLVRMRTTCNQWYTKVQGLPCSIRAQMRNLSPCDNRNLLCCCLCEV